MFLFCSVSRHSLGVVDQAADLGREAEVGGMAFLVFLEGTDSHRMVA